MVRGHFRSPIFHATHKSDKKTVHSDLKVKTERKQCGSLYENKYLRSYTPTDREHHLISGIFHPPAPRGPQHLLWTGSIASGLANTALLSLNRNEISWNSDHVGYSSWYFLWLWNRFFLCCLYCDNRPTNLVWDLNREKPYIVIVTETWLYTCIYWFLMCSWVFGSRKA